VIKHGTTELILGMVARAGIITAHGLEMFGGIHTLTIVMVLWSIEEFVDIQFSARHLHHRHKKKR
jgi:hypothetical protein